MLKPYRGVVFPAAVFLLLFGLSCSQDGGTDSSALDPIEELGRRIFFDTTLSSPSSQGCVSCHNPLAGWSGPSSHVNGRAAIYEGAVRGRFGNRKPPTAAYAGYSPKLYRDKEGNFVGGMFWDARASGHLVEDPLTEQAMGPFLNPLEQNNPGNKEVVGKVRASTYAELFREVWGKDVFEKDVDIVYELIARSVAAFERSAEVNPFSSKFDDFWRAARSQGMDVAGIDASNMAEFKGLGLDDAELKGLMLFNTKGECSECHILESQNGTPPLFTDFTYDNLGVPKNPENPFYAMDAEWNPDGVNWIDKGLGGFLATSAFSEFAEENMGKQKVPTLRNVDLRPHQDFVKAFMHNGVFKSLKDVVHFYNTRDMEGEEWPDPEMTINMNTDELGDLGLTDEEEKLIVLFMKTLSDRLL